MMTEATSTDPHPRQPSDRKPILTDQMYSDAKKTLTSLVDRGQLSEFKAVEFMDIMARLRRHGL